MSINRVRHCLFANQCLVKVFELNTFFFVSPRVNKKNYCEQEKNGMMGCMVSALTQQTTVKCKKTFWICGFIEVMLCIYRYNMTSLPFLPVQPTANLAAPLAFRKCNL